MIDLASPAFPDDDGAANPQVRARLLDQSDSISVARYLRNIRVLACVIAVADEVDAAGADKDSHMAVVSMVTADGRRGLLAFTGLDALRAFDPQARPVPALGRDVARAALDEGAAAVVIDVVGPQTVVCEGAGLAVLADVLDMDAVEAVIRMCLSGLSVARTVGVDVRDVRGEGLEADVLVEVAGSGDSVAQTAQALAGCVDLMALVPGGLAIAPVIAPVIADPPA